MSITLLDPEKNSFTIITHTFLADSNASSRSDHSEYERDVLCILHESLPSLPITSADLIDQLRKNLNADVSSTDIHKILEKLAAQDIVKLVNFHFVLCHAADNYCAIWINVKIV